jgi:Zn-dependent protease with chaperone function
MEKSLQIKGITRFEYPVLYAVLERNMKAYNITKIKVKIVEHGFRAGTYSILGDSLLVSKKLLEVLNEDELETTVAHEFSHIFHRDFYVRICILVLFTLPLIGFIITFIIKMNKIFSDFRLFIFAIIYFLIAFYIFNIGIKIANWISVQQESRADWEALLKTKNPEALKNALFKMEIEPFTTNTQPRYFEITSIGCGYILWYFHGHTHPILKERLEYLELAERMLKAQGSEIEKR